MSGNVRFTLQNATVELKCVRCHQKEQIVIVFDENVTDKTATFDMMDAVIEECRENESYVLDDELGVICRECINELTLQTLQRPKGYST